MADPATLLGFLDEKATCRLNRVFRKIHQSRGLLGRTLGIYLGAICRTRLYGNRCAGTAPPMLFHQGEANSRARTQCAIQTNTVGVSPRYQ